MKPTLLGFPLILTLLSEVSCAAYPKLPKWGKYTKKLIELAANSSMQQAFQDHISKYASQKSPLLKEFPCAPLPDHEPPTSVHRLTAADVGVVAALGDSITAGTGVKARSIIGLLIEWHGLSWSGGGDGDVESSPTLPNFIKKYNPNVKGYSTKTGSYKNPSSHLNVADPGAKSEDMPFQAQLLVERLKEEPDVDFNNDWKVITLFIGGNDLCDYCDDKEKYSADNYKANVQSALDILHSGVPRAFVNLVQVLTVPMVEELNEGLICNALHLYGCKCGAFPDDDAARQELLDAVLAYRKAMEDLVLDGRYDTRDDFTVVLQPFMTETSPPRDSGFPLWDFAALQPKNPDEPDLDYFAPDCFHFSEKGQAAAAEGLWNNMVEPVGQKRTSWSPGQAVECPDAENPFFWTHQNSEAQHRAPNAPAPASLNSEKFMGQVQGQQLLRTQQQKSPENEDQFSPTAVVLGCVMAVAVVGVGLGIALNIRKRRRQSNPESVGILLHSVNRVVYN